MLPWNLLIACAVILAVFRTTPASSADTFPTKAIHFVVPAAPGGALDITTRLIARKMSENLGQPVIVENRAGGDNLIGIRYVKDAPADGYTVLSTASGISVLPALKQDPGYDPVKDFTGIGLMSLSPMLIEVGSGQPFKTAAEFIAAAKANPNQMSYGSAGVGTPPHLALALFLDKVGVTITHIPYRGNGAALPDVAGGRVTMICDGYTSSLPYLQSGKLRPLGVTGDKRLAALPDVPTFKEQGIDYSYSLWFGLVAPAATPEAVIKQLSEALRQATTSKEISERFHDEGTEPGNDTPAAFNRFLAHEVVVGKQVVSDLKIPRQ